MPCKTLPASTSKAWRPFKSCEGHRKPARMSSAKASVTSSQGQAVQIADVKEIPQRYKGILLDQFGVLHDGKQAYSDALEATRKLVDAGRKLVILSNSSRRSDTTLPRLQDLGFDTDLFSGAVTSGELTFVSLRDRPDSWWTDLGRRCVHFTWGSRGAVSLEGLELEVEMDPEDADFILAHGTEVLGRGEGHQSVLTDMVHFKAMLQKAANKGLPLIIANPDVVTVSGKALIPMPGTFAQWYNDMGGEVRMMGKPDPVIYKAAMEIMGLAPDEVLAIGDSLEHDISDSREQEETRGKKVWKMIAGAAAAGIDSLFVLGGIHADDLGVSAEQLEPDQGKLAKLYDDHKAHPQFTIPFLR